MRGVHIEKENYSVDKTVSSLHPVRLVGTVTILEIYWVPALPHATCVFGHYFILALSRNMEL
jgi:hypothetical protein